MYIKSFNNFNNQNLIQEAVLNIDNSLLDIIKTYQKSYNQNWAKIANAILWACESGKDFQKNKFDIVSKSDTIGFLGVKTGRHTNELKVAKVINTILNSIRDEYTDDLDEILKKPDIIQKFADEIIGVLKSSSIKSTGENLSDGRQIKLVSGMDIVYWYDQKNTEDYTQISGGKGGKTQLDNSCMAGSYASKYLEFYALNPKAVQLLIITRNDKLVARGLVWTITEGPCDYFLDRCYCHEMIDQQIMYDWLIQNYPGKKVLSRSFPYYDYDFKIELENCLTKHGYPYVDSFNILYIKFDGEKLINEGYLTNRLSKANLEEIKSARLTSFQKKLKYLKSFFFTEKPIKDDWIGFWLKGHSLLSPGSRQAVLDRFKKYSYYPKRTELPIPMAWGG